MTNMTGKPLVSIIVPVHNAERFLRSTLESIEGQSYPNIETIVIDDHSSDQSFDIAASYRSTNMTLLRSVNHGASAARNLGISVASGDYIQFLDADDLISPDKISNQVDTIDGQEQTISSCAWQHFHESLPSAPPESVEVVWKDYDIPWHWLRDSWSGGGMMQTACWLTPKPLIDAAGPWDETLSLHDDGEYFSRVLFNARRISFCESAIVYYRTGLPDSLSQRTSLQAARSAFRVCELYAEHSRRFGLEQALSDGLAHNFCTNLYRFSNEAPSECNRAWNALLELGVPANVEVGGRVFRKLVQVLGFRNAYRLRKSIRSIGRSTVERKAQFNLI